MKYDKVIYFRYMPLTVKVANDFYMFEAQSVGIKIEYWDITKLFFKNTYNMEDASNIIKTIKFDNINQFEDAVAFESVHSKALFISIITFEAKVKHIFEIFTKYQCNTGVFGRNMFPVLQGKNKSFFSRVKHLNFSKIVAYIKNEIVRLQKNNGKINGYTVIFIGGEEGWRGIGSIGYEEVSKAELVKVNSDDYDAYLMQQDEPSIIGEDYILFLDEYLPLHPDTMLFGIKNIKPEQYYPELCAFFTRIERKYKMPVLIAAHPKALKYHERDYFEGRSVFFGKTAALSKHASFVLAHDTTSINYPIAFGIRLHFISSDAIEREINPVHQNTMHFAQFLGCNFERYNLIEEDVDVISEVPKEKYNRYKYSFQTWPETENRQSKDIFIEYLKK